MRGRGNTHGGEVQISGDGGTIWVHSNVDGSTVGRFSRRFGMDVHNTVSAQMGGAPQCLNCTHEPATQAQWSEFISLMNQHYGIDVPQHLMKFDK